MHRGKTAAPKLMCTPCFPQRHNSQHVIKGGAWLRSTFRLQQHGAETAAQDSGTLDCISEASPVSTIEIPLLCSGHLNHQLAYCAVGT